jgi:acetyl/propionyl-CoA carboxylase alpha subunit
MLKERRINKLFIANRGEVCRRIASTTKRLGISTATVAVNGMMNEVLSRVIDTFVDVDDQRANPYLDIDTMIGAAKQSGSDAIHPGFGFLSENDDFAAACVKAGLTWVGPKAAAIKAMASKAAARQLAVDHGVPVNVALQGILWREQDQDFLTVERFAKSTGYPILVKAAYGGGGKGMRIVRQDSELREALHRCHSEAVASFANGELLIEKYIEAPRHVEVQVIGDQYGQAFVIGDRDCSLQRRHQKVIEEAPAPDLNDLTRKELHAAALKLCHAVGYDNAGTVEFLVDASIDSRKAQLQSFYFLEMNTRLQVEHPVTEEVFGIDLVEQQIRVASGHKLQDFSNLSPRGWSVEARIYAEDPSQNFLPSPGLVYRFEAGLDLGIRWEVGIDARDEISTRYDPMIAKCIATGPDRLSALDRLAQALDETILFGPKNNISFIQSLCRDESFRRGAVTTHFITRELPKLLQSSADHQAQIAVKLKQLCESGVVSDRRGTSSASIPERSSAVFATSVSHSTSQSSRVLASESCVHRLRPQLTINTLKESLELGGRQLVLTRTLVQGPQQEEQWLHCRGVVHHDIIAQSTLGQYTADATSGLNIEAPVPGKVVLVKASEGDKLDKNQVVLVLESMKMEFEIKANKSGLLAKVLVQAGNQVEAGQVLAVWND